MSRGLLQIMLVTTVALGGCAVHVARRSPWDIQQLTELSGQLEEFKTLAHLNAEEAEQLRRVKEALEQRLATTEARVGYDERGVVARLIDQVLFDVGKAELRREATAVLDQVARVLQDASRQPVRVEGHTDNQPIRYSGWADNTALSVARAKAVTDYFVAHHQLDRSRFLAVGYGEAQPIASNDAPAGRHLNSRFENVVLPRAAEGLVRSASADAPQTASVSSK